MRLRINNNKDGTKNLYVLKSYRTDNGKSTTKIVEKLGTYAELSKVHEDPIAWAKGYVEELNRKEKEKTLEVTLKFKPAEQIEKDEKRLYEGGYLF